MRSLFTGIVWGFALIGVSASITYLYAVNQDISTRNSGALSPIFNLLIFNPPIYLVNF